LFSDGWAAKSNVSKLLVCGKCALNATLYVAALTIDALQFAQAQQIARIIGTILRRFHGDFFVLAGECGKLQSLEMIIQQHLGCDDRRR